LSTACGTAANLVFGFANLPTHAQTSRINPNFFVSFVCLVEAIVGRTLVPVEQRRVFLGRMAGPMLALLAVAVTGCPQKPGTLGITSDRPPRAESAGIRPEAPGSNPAPAQTRPITPPATNQPASPATHGVRPDRP